MKICEEYDSIQGEGKYIGVPSRFIRTTGCNLRCAWKNPDSSITTCDTPFTSWNAEKGYELDLENTLKELRNTNIRHVVITGGEPILQKDLGEVSGNLLENDYHVTIETNATIYVEVPEDVFMSLSPKLRSSYAGSGNEVRLHERNNHFIEPLRQWVANNDYQLKLVVNNGRDIEEILEIVKQIGASPDRVYLMPQGTTRRQFNERKDLIAGYCKDYGFKYSPRLHIDLWGDRRRK